MHTCAQNRKVQHVCQHDMANANIKLKDPNVQLKDHWTPATTEHSVSELVYGTGKSVHKSSSHSSITEEESVG